MICKIVTINWLGLRIKKQKKKTSKDKYNQIVCLQETKIKNNYHKDILTSIRYSCESERNSYKSRCGIKISNKIGYARKHGLGGENSHLVIININKQYKTGFIYIYCSCNPAQGLTQCVFNEFNY